LSLELNPSDQAGCSPPGELPSGRRPPASEEDVLEAVRTILADVIGEEYVSEIEIERETSFYADLQIESIEFVALAEQLQARYGDRVDFPAWMATMDVDEIIAMTVGRLVDYILAALS
jgi:acyl carrier protein